MPRNQTERVPEIEEIIPVETDSPAAVPDETERPLSEQFPPEKLASARDRLRDLEETVGWETDKTRLAKLHGEIRDLNALIRKYDRPTLRVIKGGDASDNARTIEVPEFKPLTAVSLAEINETIGELKTQRNGIMDRLGEAKTKADKVAVKQQIEHINAEIKTLSDERAQRANRRRTATAPPSLRVVKTARLNESFKAFVERDTEEKKNELDQERQKTLSRLAKAKKPATVIPITQAKRAAAKHEPIISDELVTSPAEQEFFGATEEEAHERAEAFERFEGKLTPKEAVKEKRAVEARAPKSDAEARRNLIQAIDRLHEDYPDYVTFTGREYIVALEAPPAKTGFFRKVLSKLSGEKPLAAVYDAAIEQIPANVSPIRKFIEAQKASLPRFPSIGVKMR